VSRPTIDRMLSRCVTGKAHDTSMLAIHCGTQSATVGSTTAVTSGLRREVCENFAIMCYYAASNGNSLPTFRDNLSVPSSGFKNMDS
jgi:hypothetical protein